MEYDRIRVTTVHQISSYRNHESKFSCSDGIYPQSLPPWSKNHTKKKFLWFSGTYSVAVIKYYGKKNLNIEEVIFLFWFFRLLVCLLVCVVFLWLTVWRYSPSWLHTCGALVAGTYTSWSQWNFSEEIESHKCACSYLRPCIYSGPSKSATTVKAALPTTVGIIQIILQG